MIRSEPEKEFKSEDNFIELVGNNFESIVYDTSKDVLVTFCPKRYTKCTLITNKIS